MAGLKGHTWDSGLLPDIHISGSHGWGAYQNVGPGGCNRVAERAGTLEGLEDLEAVAVNEVGYPSL